MNHHIDFPKRRFETSGSFKNQKFALEKLKDNESRKKAENGENGKSQGKYGNYKNV